MRKNMQLQDYEIPSDLLFHIHTEKEYKLYLFAILIFVRL